MPASRSAATRHRRRSRRSTRSWPPTKARTSRAPSSRSTAAKRLRALFARRRLFAGQHAPRLRADAAGAEGEGGADHALDDAPREALALLGLRVPAEGPRLLGQLFAGARDDCADAVFCLDCHGSTTSPPLDELRRPSSPPLTTTRQKAAICRAPAAPEGSSSLKSTKPAAIRTAFVVSVAIPAAVSAAPRWNAACSTLVPKP